MTKEEKDQFIEQLQDFFTEERGEELGTIGAENFIDFLEKEYAPLVYNKALFEARQALEQQWMSLEEELYSLEKKKTL